MNDFVYLWGKFASNIRRELVNNVCIQIARWVHVAQNDRESLWRSKLLCSNVGGSEPIATVCWWKIDCMRHLKMVTQSLVDHQLSSFEEHRHYVWRYRKEIMLEVGIDRFSTFMRNSWKGSMNANGKLCTFAPLVKLFHRSRILKGLFLLWLILKIHWQIEFKILNWLRACAYVSHGWWRLSVYSLH